MGSIPIYTTKLIEIEAFESSIDRILKPEDAVEVLKPKLTGLDREHIVIMMLTSRYKVAGLETVSIGSLDTSLAVPREVFRSAIIGNSYAILVAHNHPSQDPTPSGMDLDLTEKLISAAAILGIEFIDHLILTDKSWTSIRQFSESSVTGKKASETYRHASAFKQPTASAKLWTKASSCHEAFKGYVNDAQLGDG